jgi:hypothetical protein
MSGDHGGSLMIVTRDRRPVQSMQSLVAAGARHVCAQLPRHDELPIRMAEQA